jgi:hypothetical protein
MRRALLMCTVAILALAVYAKPAGAAEPGWHSESPVGALGVPAPLGEVGDIEFWSPNRGALITAGIPGVTPAGVYVYDGTGWHLYSTVCGGEQGRIAWSGPDEFWTVSRYATPQAGRPPLEEVGRTLCHFQNGEVVASYAKPLGAATAYQRMKAAACEGPSDCWFAGEALPLTAPNVGAFHLHWDGGALTELPSLVEPEAAVEDAPGDVTGLAFLAGSLYESNDEKPFIRQIGATPSPFFDGVAIPEGAEGPFVLAGDDGQLWALGTNGESALRDIGGGFEKVSLTEPVGTVGAAASEPNSAAVWAASVAYGPIGPDESVSLVRIGAAGEVSTPVLLPQPGEEIEPKGAPSAMSCPSAGQCWLATTEGWLFHLGGSLPQDTDPAMHALITFRPEDESTRVFVPPGLPADDSGETERASHSGSEVLEHFPEEHRRPPIVYDVHQKILGKRVLELSFKLRARAHVQLRAKFHGKVVAKTPRLTLDKGPHKIHLKLNPKRWPTGLDFQVHPVARKKKK